MRLDQLEAWVLSLVDAVDRQDRVEDARVELKADWPEPSKAARRIAGHANAARSEHILWIVGIDENRGVVRTESPDTASWIAQVNAQFDGIGPSLVLDIVVPVGKNSVTALLFDTTRRPFVVKNPAYNKQGGGPVSLEVPWRTATAVRSARREDLMRVLVPRTDLPSIEVLAASGAVEQNDGLKSGWVPPDVTDVRRAEHLSWRFRIKLYVTPPSLDPLVLPTHRASFTFSLGSEHVRSASEIRFWEPTRSSTTRTIADSSTVHASQGEALLTGPGLLVAEARRYEPVVQVSRDELIAAELVITPARSDERIRLGFELSPVGDSPPTPWNWILVSAQPNLS